MHVRLVRRYVQRAVGRDQAIRELPLPAPRGSAEQFVRTQFPGQVKECRQRAAHASTLLIVVIDADTGTVENRRGQLAAELQGQGLRPLSDTDPVAVLIPRRNVETWILCLVGRTVDEDTGYSGARVGRDQIKQAARTAFEWSRPGAEVPDRCVPLLRASFPEWRRIESPAAQ